MSNISVKEDVDKLVEPFDKKEYQKEYQRNNRDKVNEYQREYLKKQREEAKAFRELEERKEMDLLQHEIFCNEMIKYLIYQDYRVYNSDWKEVTFTNE